MTTLTTFLQLDCETVYFFLLLIYISKLNSVGVDRISVKMLMCRCFVVLPFITHLIDVCLEESLS